MSGRSAVADIDALFQLPLGEFTSARNALSAQLKKDGRAAEAGEVKELAKPSISAWAVNQLYWQQRELFDRLLEAGERLRRAQRSGDSAREAVTARRDALAELARIAEAILRDGGYGATRDMLRRVTTTLEALSSFGSAPGAPAAGRIVDDVEPPGFDALAGLLQGRPRASSRQNPVPLRSPATRPPQRPDRADTAKAREEHKRLLAAAKTAVRGAERAAAAARKEVERAGAASSAAAAHAAAARRKREHIERRLARATKEAATAEERARQAARGADEAAAAQQSAQRALEVAHRHAEQIARKKP